MATSSGGRSANRAWAARSATVVAWRYSNIRHSWPWNHTASTVSPIGPAGSAYSTRSSIVHVAGPSGSNWWRCSQWAIGPRIWTSRNCSGGRQSRCSATQATVAGPTRRQLDLAAVDQPARPSHHPDTLPRRQQPIERPIRASARHTPPRPRPVTATGGQTRADSSSASPEVRNESTALPGMQAILRRCRAISSHGKRATASRVGGRTRRIVEGCRRSTCESVDRRQRETRSQLPRRMTAQLRRPIRARTRDDGSGTALSPMASSALTSRT